MYIIIIIDNLHSTCAWISRYISCPLCHYLVILVLWPFPLMYPSPALWRVLSFGFWCAVSRIRLPRSHHDTAVGNMWPCLSKWVRWILGHFLFEGSSLFIYFLFLGFGSSAKSDCPIFLCIRMMQKCLQMSLKHCLNMHLLVAKDCIAKTLFANFSEWSVVVVATYRYNNK